MWQACFGPAIFFGSTLLITCALQFFSHVQNLFYDAAALHKYSLYPKPTFTVINAFQRHHLVAYIMMVQRKK